MAVKSFYCYSGYTGSVACPITGQAQICGPDTASGSAGNDGNAGGIADPFKTLDGGLQFANVTSGDVVTLYCAGRLRTLDVNSLAFGLVYDDTGVQFTIRQWDGMPPMCFRGDNFPGAADPTNALALTQNKEIAALSWVLTTRGYTMICAGGVGGQGIAKSDLRGTAINGISAVMFDADLAANVVSHTFIDKFGVTQTSGRTQAHLRSMVAGSSGYRLRGSGVWAASTGYSLGDTLANGGLTYVCIVAHTSDANPVTGFATDLAAVKWILYTTLLNTLRTDATGLYGVYLWDFQTGALSVRLPTGSTPATATANGICHVVKDKSGISFQSTSTVLDNQAPSVYGGSAANPGRFQYWCDSSATAPYGSGINFLYSINAYMQDLIFQDSGDHAYAGGGKVQNFNTARCHLWGMQEGCVTCVWNASGGSNSATGEAMDAVWDLHSLLGHDGLSVSNTLSIFGGYVHGPHTKVKLTRIHVTHHVPTSGQVDLVIPWDSDNGVAPSSFAHASNFPVYVKDCSTWQGVGFNNQGVTTYIGMENCVLRGQQMYQRNSGYFIDRRTAIGRWKFEGCSVMADNRNSNGAANASLYGIGNQFTIDRLNTSSYDMAIIHSDAHTYSVDFFYTAIGSGGKVVADGDIVGFRDVTSRSAAGDGLIASATFQVVAGDNTFAASSVDYDDCAYWNIGAATWSDDAARNTTAEWASTVDSGQYVPAANPFADATGASLEPTAVMKKVKRSVTPHAAKGYNGKDYGALFGGWQPGTGTASKAIRLGMLGGGFLDPMFGDPWWLLEEYG